MIDNGNIPESPPVSRIWRAFYLDGGRLAGFTGTIWWGEEMEAVCLVLTEREHQAPQLNCKCGIYGYYEAAPVWYDQIEPYLHQQQTILAHCSFWGQVIMGDRGLRVANARIEKAYVIDAGRLLWNTNLCANSLRRTYPTVDWTVVTKQEVLTTLLH